MDAEVERNARRAAVVPGRGQDAAQQGQDEPDGQPVADAGRHSAGDVSSIASETAAPWNG